MKPGCKRSPVEAKRASCKADGRERMPPLPRGKKQQLQSRARSPLQTKGGNQSDPLSRPADTSGCIDCRPDGQDQTSPLILNPYLLLTDAHAHVRTHTFMHFHADW